MSSLGLHAVTCIQNAILILAKDTPLMMCGGNRTGWYSGKSPQAIYRDTLNYQTQRAKQLYAIASSPSGSNLSEAYAAACTLDECYIDGKVIQRSAIDKLMQRYREHPQAEMFEALSMERHAQHYFEWLSRGRPGLVKTFSPEFLKEFPESKLKPEVEKLQREKAAETK